MSSLGTFLGTCSGFHGCPAVPSGTRRPENTRKHGVFRATSTIRIPVAVLLHNPRVFGGFVVLGVVRHGPCHSRDSGWSVQEGGEALSGLVLSAWGRGARSGSRCAACRRVRPRSRSVSWPLSARFGFGYGLGSHSPAELPSHETSGRKIAEGLDFVRQTTIEFAVQSSD